VTKPLKEPSIDPRVLDEFRVLMGPALAEALECYLADTPVQLSDMHSALVNDDHVALQLCAHSLKATCATVGAMELRSLAERIEAHARARNSCSDAQALTAAALASFEKLKPHFQALIASERDGVPAVVAAVAQR
jgi:HPt (histidine-containing phosphotransfer) domain-containing protein